MEHLPESTKTQFKLWKRWVTSCEYTPSSLHQRPALASYKLHVRGRPDGRRFLYAMRYDVPNPKNPVNDRFCPIERACAPLLYAGWAEGARSRLSDLKRFRQFTSELEGHLPRLPWVGSRHRLLGQGLSCGVGMALNGKYLDKTAINIFVLMGDAKRRKDRLGSGRDRSSTSSIT